MCRSPRKWILLCKYLLLFCLAVAVVTNISGVLASDWEDDSQPGGDGYYSVSEPISISESEDFGEVVLYVSNDKDLLDHLTAQAVDFNISSDEPIDLPGDSYVVKLPDNRVGISFGNENRSILPVDTEVIMYHGYSEVTIPNSNSTLRVSNVVELPTAVQDISETAVYHQSIERLNNYEVDINFHELSKSTVSNAISSYAIDWGDNHVETYDSNQINPNHIYRESGTYELQMDVTDEFGYTYTIKRNYEVEYEGHLTHGALWVKENPEPVAASTTSGLGLASLGFIALTETGKYKFLALLSVFIPLYTHIQKEDVLDQFVRGQIFGYIKTHPGAHYNQIRREMDIKNGTLSYHLRVLEKTELIKSRREGLKYRAFYPTGMVFPKKERFRLTELQIKIIDTIREHDGINQKNIAKILDQKPQTINYNIKVLEQADIIDVTKKGRKTRCFYKEPQDFSEQPAE